MSYKTISIILGSILLALVVAAIFYFLAGKDNFSGTQSTSKLTIPDTQNIVPLLKTITWYQVSLPLKNDEEGILSFKTAPNDTVHTVALPITRAAQIILLLQNKKLGYLDKYQNHDYQSLILTEDFNTKDSTNP